MHTRPRFPCNYPLQEREEPARFKSACPGCLLFRRQAPEIFPCSNRAAQLEPTEGSAGRCLPGWRKPPLSTHRAWHKPDFLSPHYRLKHKLKLVPQKKDWTRYKSLFRILGKNEDVFEMWWEGWQEFDVSVEVRGNSG